MNRTLLSILFATLVCMSSASCSLLGWSDDPLPLPPEWSYEKEAIVIHLSADNQLNREKNKAYTLYFVVYQLSDPNMFNQLTEDKDGLEKLLETKIFDPSVASVKSMVIYPGSDVTYKVDRSQNARYVGIVTGYNVLSRERIIRLYKIPVHEEEEDGVKKIVPSRLTVDLYLSPTQIVDIQG